MVACKVSSIIPHDKNRKTEPGRIPPTNRVKVSKLKFIIQEGKSFRHLLQIGTRLRRRF